MKIILTASVSGLGKVGDVVEVKNGFAKNFLIPNKKAICMTKNNQTLFEAKKAEFEQANDNVRKSAEDAQRKLIAQNIVIIENASDDGRLYGSVNTTVIVNKINEVLGDKIVDKANISLAKPIKEIGVYSVRLDLHSEAVFNVKLVVSRSESEVDSLVKADEKAKKDAQKSSEPVEKKKKSKEESSEEAAQNKEETKTEEL